jgi:hypothetical protein
MGKVTPVTFISYEKTLERFEKEWQEIIKAVRKGKK